MPGRRSGPRFSSRSRFYSPSVRLRRALRRRTRCAPASRRHPWASPRARSATFSAGSRKNSSSDVFAEAADTELVGQILDFLRAANVRDENRVGRVYHDGIFHTEQCDETAVGGIYEAVARAEREVRPYSGVAGSFLRQHAMERVPIADVAPAEVRFDGHDFPIRPGFFHHGVVDRYVRHFSVRALKRRARGG